MKVVQFQVTLDKVPDDLTSIGLGIALSKVIGDAVRGTGIEVRVAGEGKVNFIQEPEPEGRVE